MGLDLPAVKMIAETLWPPVDWNHHTLRLIQALERHELDKDAQARSEEERQRKAEHGGS